MTSGQPPELVRAAYWKAAGQVLQQLRERRGWSGAELAERAGVSEGLVAAYEQARVRYPELEACWRLAAALGVALPALLAAAERRAGVGLLGGVRALAGTATPAEGAAEDAGALGALDAFVRQARAPGG